MSSGTGSHYPRITFVSGTFQARFDDERLTQAAARDATAAGFTHGVSVDDAGGWLLDCRRREPFPADEQHRYAGRLRSIATKHGGAYDGFIPD